MKNGTATNSSKFYITCSVFSAISLLGFGEHKDKQYQITGIGDRKIKEVVFKGKNEAEGDRLFTVKLNNACVDKIKTTFIEEDFDFEIIYIEGEFDSMDMAISEIVYERKEIEE